MMEANGILYTYSLKISTKYVFVTNFNSEMDYERSTYVHNLGTQNILKFPSYANALIVNVVGERIEVC